MATATGSLRRIVYTSEASGFKAGFKEGADTGTILRNTGDSLNLTKTSFSVL